MTEPWPGASIPDVACCYVVCTQDTLLPPERQRGFAAALGVAPIVIIADHAVVGIKPEELAAILASLTE